ncbi:MAG: hypothetical protein HQM14_02050 [SAR324 cluster bacterium]|nr:hypothetical protein [SAR324 cluster bacterium]
MACCILLCTSLAGKSFAYQPTWQDMMHHVLQNSKQWDRVMLTTKVHVFDPFANENGKGQRSAKVSEWGYQQKIYWEMNNFLTIETFDHNQQLLHFYYEADGDEVSSITQQDRYFSKMDVFPHYLLFVVSRGKDWEKALQAINVHGTDISLYRDKDYSTFYRIGDQSTDHFVLLDQHNFLLKALNYSVRTEEKNHTIQVLFKRLTKYKKLLSYPIHTDYYLDNRLFKRVVIDSFERPPKLPKEILRQKAIKWSQNHSALLQTDYTR